MSRSFICVSVEADQNTNKEKIIESLGYELLEKVQGVFRYDDLEYYEDLLLHQSENRVILFGECLHNISNNIVSHKEIDTIFANQLSLHLIYEVAEEDSCFIAYFEKGRPGPAHQVMGIKKKAWSRTFTQDQLPIPHSRYVNSAISELSTFLDAEYDLINRIYSGMHGKGNYGVGFHPDESKWVACKKGIIPDDTELQEIDAFNYRKKRKPFKRTKHPDAQTSFYNQKDLACEIHHRTFENLTHYKIAKFLNSDKAIFEKYRVKYSL